jgi:hypothetical protein
VILLALVLLAFGGIYAGIRRAAGPVVNGRTLSGWLAIDPEQLPPQAWRAHDRDIREAFREAGPVGMEFLLDAIQERESGWRWKLLELARPVRHPIQADRWETRLFGKSRRASLLAFTAARKDESVCPLLSIRLAEAERILILTNQNRWLGAQVQMQVHDARESCFWQIARLLAATGPAGLPALTNALRPGKPAMINSPLLDALMAGGSNAVPAVPAIIAVAEDPAMFAQVVRALMVIQGRADLSVPVLLRAATNGHVGAVSALGEFGPEVKHLLPQLLPLTTNSDPQVSFQAEIAVRKIQGR